MSIVSDYEFPFWAGTSTMILTARRDGSVHDALIEIGPGTYEDVVFDPYTPEGYYPKVRITMTEQDDVYGASMTVRSITGAGALLGMRDSITSPAYFFDIADESVLMESFDIQHATFSDGEYVMFEYNKLKLGCFSMRSATPGPIYPTWSTFIPVAHRRDRFSKMFSAKGTMAMIDGLADTGDATFPASDGATVVNMHTGDISLIQFPSGQQKDALIAFTRSGRLLLINGILRSSMERSMSVDVVDIKSVSTSVIPLNFQGGDTEFTSGYVQEVKMWYAPFSQSPSGGTVAITIATGSTNVTGEGMDLLLINTDTSETSFHSGCIPGMTTPRRNDHVLDAIGLVGDTSFVFVDTSFNATVVRASCVAVPEAPAPVTTGEVVPPSSGTTINTGGAASSNSTTTAPTDGSSVNGVSGASNIYPVIAVMFFASILSLNV